MPSYFVPHISSNNKTVTLEGDEFHHLSHVKRIAIGQPVKLNNGAGVIAEGKVRSITKHHAEIEIKSVTQTPKHEPHFAIAFALLRNRHDELLIEKCTELGASAYFPIITEFSVKSPSANTLHRFEKIALAAIKQCDNPWLPQIHPVQSFEQALKTIKELGYTAVLCSEQKPDAGIGSLNMQQNYCFLIGPEGGFSQKEFDLCFTLNIPSISICPLITRAETAAIAIAAQFHAAQTL